MQSSGGYFISPHLALEAIELETPALEALILVCLTLVFFSSRMQWKIINTALNEGRDQCVVMATGEAVLFARATKLQSFVILVAVPFKFI